MTMPVGSNILYIIGKFRFWSSEFRVSADQAAMPIVNINISQLVLDTSNSLLAIRRPVYDRFDSILDACCND